MRDQNSEASGAARLFARNAVSVFVLLMIYDGAIRKWVLPQYEQILFVLKDALIFASALILWIKYRTPLAPMPPHQRTFLVAYLTYAALQGFNFLLPNLLVGAWGVKSHLLYATLLLVLPAAYCSCEDFIESISRAYFWLVAPVCLLAFVQLEAPADSFINLQVRGGLDGISTFGEEGLVRITGTFSYISGMAAFLQISVAVGFALLLLGFRSPKFLIGLVLAVAALPATGSRAVIVFACFAAVLALFSFVRAQLMTWAGMVKGLVLICCLLLISIELQGEAWEALKQRASEARADEDRIFSAFTNAFSYMDMAGFFGYGAGAANFGAPSLASSVVPFSWLPIGGAFEEESGRLVIELGAVGWFLSLCMRLSFVLWALWLCQRAITRWARSLACIGLPILIVGAYQGNGVFAPPASAAFYWFAVAMLMIAQRETLALGLYASELYRLRSHAR